MNLRTTTLLLALAFPTAAHAENFYEYGLRVLKGAPQVMQSPGEIEVAFDLPGYVRLDPPSGKHCAYHPLWDGSEVPVDRFTSLQYRPTNYYEGRVRLVWSDNHPGRTYQVCIRQPYTPLEEPEE